MDNTGQRGAIANMLYITSVTIDALILVRNRQAKQPATVDCVYTSDRVILAPSVESLYEQHRLRNMM